MFDGRALRGAPIRRTTRVDPKVGAPGRAATVGAASMLRDDPVPCTASPCSAPAADGAPAGRSDADPDPDPDPDAGVDGGVELDVGVAVGSRWTSPTSGDLGDGDGCATCGAVATGMRRAGRSTDGTGARSAARGAPSPADVVDGVVPVGDTWPAGDGFDGDDGDGDDGDGCDGDGSDVGRVVGRGLDVAAGRTVDAGDDAVDDGGVGAGAGGSAACGSRGTESAGRSGTASVASASGATASGRSSMRVRCPRPRTSPPTEPAGAVGVRSCTSVGAETWVWCVTDRSPSRRCTGAVSSNDDVVGRKGGNARQAPVGLGWSRTVGVGVGAGAGSDVGGAVSCRSRRPNGHHRTTRHSPAEMRSLIEPI